MKRALTIFLFIITASNSFAEETFSFIGSYDNVKATESGHCNGNGVSLWELGDKKIIGLFHVAQGLCGDPSCSIVKGNIEGENLSFKSIVPIYNKSYTFEGKPTKLTLSGLLNNNEIELKKDSMPQIHKNKIEWCAFWLKVSRCKGVESVCN